MDPKLEMKFQLLLANIILTNQTCTKQIIIFSAESHALLVALQQISTSKRNKYIFPDAMSTLKPIAKIKLSNHLISHIVEKYQYMSKRGMNIVM